MNKRFLITARILTVLAALTAIGGSLLRSFLLTNAYDLQNGFYTDNTLHAVLRYSLIAFAVIAFAIGHIYIKEGNCSIFLPQSKVFKVVCSVVGCVLGGFLLYVFAKAVLPVFERPGAADLAMAFFACIAMLYYFSAGKKGDFRALLCSASALLLLALVFGLYFNPKVSYINHSVVLCYAASIFTMLAFTAEANFALGRSAYRRYLSYAPVATALSVTLAIPDILLCITAGACVLPDLFYDILLLAFGLYHFVRLVLLSATTKKED